MKDQEKYYTEKEKKELLNDDVVQDDLLLKVFKKVIASYVECQEDDIRISYKSWGYNNTTVKISVRVAHVDSHKLFMLENLSTRERYATPDSSVVEMSIDSNEYSIEDDKFYPLYDDDENKLPCMDINMEFTWDDSDLKDIFMAFQKRKFDAKKEDIRKTLTDELKMPDKRSESWRGNYRGDTMMMEWICEHGIGHYVAGIHGCDGCCQGDNFPGKNERMLIKAKQRKQGDEEIADEIRCQEEQTH